MKNPNAFEPSDDKFVNTDVGDAIASKSRLSSNLTAALDSVLRGLETLDEKVTEADGSAIGEKLLMFLDTTGDSLKTAADYIVESDDNCESIVDGLLAIESGTPVDEEYEYVKGTLIGIINSSPGVLLDVSAALKSLTLEEAVEISEVGLELSCVGIVLSRFVLEKVDVEGIVDEMYDGSGMVNLRNGKSSDTIQVEFLDEEDAKDDEDAPDRPSRESINRRKLKKLPLVFWPRISKILLSPFTHSDHPIRHYISRNPKLSFLLSLCLLTPPPLLISIFLLPPLLVTDEIVHKVYGALVATYPDTFEGIEITTRQMFELIKLYVLLGKLFFKMLYRIVQRQVKRRGGVGGVAKIAVSKIVYGATHPIETGGNVWEFTKDLFGLIKDLWGGIYDTMGPPNGVRGGGVGRGGFHNNGNLEIRRRDLMS